jgi:hypothetical protein
MVLSLRSGEVLPPTSLPIEAGDVAELARPRRRSPFCELFLALRESRSASLRVPSGHHEEVGVRRPLAESVSQFCALQTFLRTDQTLFCNHCA